MKSKENQVLELFYNYPTKNWHFKDIKKEISIADSKLAKWLKKFQKNNLIKKIKKQGKMPYYVGNYESVFYRNKKKLYSKELLLNSGLLNYLTSFKDLTIIIFGSIVNWDWHSESDLDIFVYGNASNLDLTKIESLSTREVQLFSCNSKKELKKFGFPLIKNILRGDLITGNLDFMEVFINA